METGRKIDASADDDHEHNAKKLKRRSTEPIMTGLSSKSDNKKSHHDTTTDDGELFEVVPETSMKQHEANITIAAPKKNAPLHCEMSRRTLYQQQAENPLIVAGTEENSIKKDKEARKQNNEARSSYQSNNFANTETTGNNSSSEPHQPLDLQAILRKYIRKKEMEAKEKERESSNLTVGEAATKVSGVFQGSDSAVSSSTEKKQLAVSSPMARTEPQTTQQQSPKTCKPRESDVLFGRGRAFRNHPGNKNMKRLVKLNREKYETARCRDDKTNLSWMIVLEIIGDGGRFLKRDKSGQGRWIQASEEEAREKVSHALRDDRKQPSSAPKAPPASLNIADQPVSTNAVNAGRLLSAPHPQQQQQQQQQQRQRQPPGAPAGDSGRTKSSSTSAPFPL